MAILDTMQVVQENELNNIKSEVKPQVSNIEIVEETKNNKDKPIELKITGPLSVYYCKALQTLFSKDKKEEEKNDTITTESQANDELLKRMVIASTEKDIADRKVNDPKLEIDYSLYTLSGIRSGYGLKEAINNIETLKANSDNGEVVLAYESIEVNDYTGLLDTYCRENNIKSFFSIESLAEWISQK